MNEEFRDELRRWLLDESSMTVSVADASIARLYPGEPHECQPGDYERWRNDPGNVLILLRIFRGVALVQESDIATDEALLKRLRSFHRSAVFLNGLVCGTSWSSNAISANAKKAADISHAENRRIADSIENWWKENHGNFRSMDAGAEAAMKVEPVSFRTARKHIGTASKKYALRAKSKTST